MAALSPIPRVSISYTTDLYSTTATITAVTLTSGTLPPGLSLSFTRIGGVSYARLSGTPTTTGSYTFNISITRSITVTQSWTTQVVNAPLSASGPIKWSEVKTITSRTGAMSASDTRFRVLANGVVNTSPVKASSCRSKPTASSLTLSTGISQSFTIPAYQSFVVRLGGAGGGGAGGGGCGVVGSFPNYFCSTVCQSGSNGSAGTQSSALGFIAYGGPGGNLGSGIANGSAVGNAGNNQNATLGGGSAGGGGNSGTDNFINLCIGSGSAGGTGGYVDGIKIILNSGIEYGSSTTIQVGTGGSPGANNAGSAATRGTDGTLYLEWA